MGFRFRKRVRLFKGTWINLSKQGGYLSIGGHGTGFEKSWGSYSPTSKIDPGQA